MKYALIGCGRVAPCHIHAARKNAMELVALCDLKEQAMQTLIQTQKITTSPRLYTDHRQLLQNEHPDLIAIATQSGAHAEIALDCIRAGIPVIIEKPIALSMQDARKIVALSEELGVLVCACHQNRFNIAIQQTRRALEAGRFGKLSHGSVTVRWNRQRDYYAQDDWRGTWAKDGGALMNQCIHGLDLLRWMMGDALESVSGFTRRSQHPYIEAEDVGMAVLRFQNGAIATLEGTTNLFDSAHESETLCLFGENGSVQIGGTNANRVDLWSFSQELPDDRSARGLSEHALNVYGNGHDSLYADVLDALCTGRAPYVDARAGARALELVLAVYKSSLTGKPVSLPLEDFSSVDMSGFFDRPEKG